MDQCLQNMAGVGRYTTNYSYFSIHNNIIFNWFFSNMWILVLIWSKLLRRFLHNIIYNSITTEAILIHSHLHIYVDTKIVVCKSNYKIRTFEALREFNLYMLQSIYCSTMSYRYIHSQLYLRSVETFQYNYIIHNI